MNINKNIKLICKVRGLSFGELAERLNITRQTLYRITEAPRLQSIERISEVLGVPAWVIIHPEPVVALRQLEGHNQAPPILQGPNHVAILVCPACNNQIILQAATLGERTTEDDSQKQGPEKP